MPKKGNSENSKEEFLTMEERLRSIDSEIEKLDGYIEQTVNQYLHLKASLEDLKILMQKSGKSVSAKINFEEVDEQLKRFVQYTSKYKQLKQNLIHFKGALLYANKNRN